MDAVSPTAGKAPPAPSHNLFEVYLRLRPSASAASTQGRILDVAEGDAASHITLNPPTDRRRAVEKFAFTRVFDEEASQLDVLRGVDVASLVEGVLAPNGGEGTDAVVATLGVTGSGKTHTILGSRTHRGLTQLTLDILFRSIASNTLDPTTLPSELESLQAADPSEAIVVTAPHFIDSTYEGGSRAASRAATPMTVTSEHGLTSPQPRRRLPRPSTTTAQIPAIGNQHVNFDKTASYVIVVSMYEVHNDRIYDLLTPASRSAATKDFRRRPLLFKSTELSPDRKVVAGLRKVVCTNLEEAIMVLEAGLVERRVAGTGSNSVSSRSHGFFCFEVRKRSLGQRAGLWRGSRLTIVDMAGSERAREAKTAGATLVEAGKINESLMYLGQCLQTQTDAGTSAKPNVVPYRQCKLTELLFSNSFPSVTAHTQAPRRDPQRGVMIVTADPRGDFNATSQILRYSALAREVTVPRIPSITATILAQTPGQSTRPPPQRTHSGAEDRATMELAALEIARMSEEMDRLRLELEAEAEARAVAEERLMDVEAAIRDECATEFEQRLTFELARFKASLAQEQERNDEHWDRKVDVLERGLDRDDDGRDDDKENVLVEDMAHELARLRRDNSVLRRELAARSPGKRAPLAERDDFGSDPTVGVGHQLERLRVSSAGSPTKRVRRIGPRRWEEPNMVE
ncbi:Kinesin-like protein [Ophiocordyceps camponoti-floridani]|uniref:Kinesin-like protein n=1 Tax=Ophiocordyceps camponoti-floridani TaxID=2030778 RepID=A0A8H4Q7H7_9HYPO|nr:Kinesin-like protein [Ophiocordyceps camponoti-floridani]